MITFNEMLIRFLVALALGAIMGLERELVGKEAGIRTSILVAGGASIFTFVGLSLPYLVGSSSGNISDIIARNSGFLTVIANIVVGIGFLGAGIIIKEEGHVRGLTTAAAVWVIAAVGTLAGLGLIKFAVCATLLLAVMLYLLRNLSISKEF